MSIPDKISNMYTSGLICKNLYSVMKPLCVFLMFYASAQCQEDHVRILKILKLTTDIPPFQSHVVRKFEPPVTTFNISVEEDSDQFEITAELFDPSLKIKIEQRYETSIVVNDEGPHLDLYDWKHYRSNWQELSCVKKGVYKSIKISREESHRFLQVPFSEVIEAVKEKGGNRWYELAKNAGSINNPPVGVGVSKISFRVSAYIDGRWTRVYTLHCRIPLGD